MTKKISGYMPNFSAYYHARAEEKYLQAIGGKTMSMKCDLPIGMGTVNA